MSRRQVTKTGKAKDGDITSLCGSTSSWSPRAKADAIRDIESNDHSYFVLWPGNKKTEIRVVEDASKAGGKYLRTDRDTSDRNNLLELPDC